MCVVYVIVYYCGCSQYLDDPLTTQCVDMRHASSKAHPVYCLEIPRVDIQSDNICGRCSAWMYLMEKQYALSCIVWNAGRPVRDLPPLDEFGVRLWVRWRHDRERFRAIGVDGGDGGELGQGWQSEVVAGAESDHDREVGVDWMVKRYGPGRMVGWKQDLEFDGFLGEMGKAEPEPNTKGLTLDMVTFGVTFD